MADTDESEDEATDESDEDENGNGGESEAADESDADEAGDDDNASSLEEVEGRIQYTNDHNAELVEVTDHGIEWIDAERQDDCLIEYTIENTSEAHEMNVHYAGALIDDTGRTISNTDDGAFLEPGETTSGSLEAYDCDAAAEYRISLDIVYLNELGGSQ